MHDLWRIPTILYCSCYSFICSVHKTISLRPHNLPGDKAEHVDRSQPRLAVGTLQTIVDSTDCKYVLEYIQWVEREIKEREREIGMIGMDR